MKIISWNIRGLGSKRKRLVLKEQLTRLRPDIVILQETKKQEIDRRLVASVWCSRFRDWVFVPSTGRSGGIVIIWNTQFVSVIDSEIAEFSVSIKIRGTSGADWWLSGIYGPCRQRDRGRFWVELAALYGLCGENWCIGGDFNVVRFVSDKSNGGGVTSSMRTFNNFINDTNLRDPRLLNASFTWSNGRENVVCRRLDRFLFTGGWEDCFPNFRQKALVRVTSDHCPIELDTSKLKWGPGPFRFENMWLEHPDFNRNFKDWWAEEHLIGWPGFNFMRRLKAVKGKLRVWSKEVFGDVAATKKLAEARIVEIDRLEGLPPTILFLFS
ncbi:uncharacterized protein LOC110762145 [Prunus avium]|uniref:Uncharacterized protein LOC110762145 n=1 Tax=Prunus avium TaxID=42229 RepID=A0A6P5T1U8_PRUAV|nr:uncharacterized protein LOC110762145 [Prunus avium]